MATQHPTLQHIETALWFDLVNYPSVGATVPQQSQNGPFTQKIVFNPPLYQVKELVLVAYEIQQPYNDQAALTDNANYFQRDPYFIVSLDGLNVAQSHVLNGVSTQGAVLPVNNQGYLTPVSWMQPRGKDAFQDTGTLSEIIVRVSRPNRLLQTPVQNTSPAVASVQTNSSPLFNRILLKLIVKRFGDVGIQSRDGLPPAPLSELPETYYADDRKIAIQQRYNTQRFN